MISRFFSFVYRSHYRLKDRQRTNLNENNTRTSLPGVGVASLITASVAAADATVSDGSCYGALAGGFSEVGGIMHCSPLPCRKSERCLYSTVLYQSRIFRKNIRFCPVCFVWITALKLSSSQRAGVWARVNDTVKSVNPENESNTGLQLNIGMQTCTKSHKFHSKSLFLEGLPFPIAVGRVHPHDTLHLVVFGHSIAR